VDLEWTFELVGGSASIEFPDNPAGRVMLPGLPELLLLSHVDKSELAVSVKLIPRPESSQELLAVATEFAAARRADKTFGPQLLLLEEKFKKLVGLSRVARTQAALEPAGKRNRAEILALAGEIGRILFSSTSHTFVPIDSNSSPYVYVLGYVAHRVDTIVVSLGEKDLELRNEWLKPRESTGMARAGDSLDDLRLKQSLSRRWKLTLELPEPSLRSYSRSPDAVKRVDLRKALIELDDHYYQNGWYLEPDDAKEFESLFKLQARSDTSRDDGVVLVVAWELLARIQDPNDLTVTITPRALGDGDDPKSHSQSYKFKKLVGTRHQVARLQFDRQEPTTVEFVVEKPDVREPATSR
jgi:hypothetical protein